MLELLATISLGLAWLVPNHYVPWVSFYNESMAAVALILFVLAVRRRWLQLRSPTVAWVVFFSAAIPVLQWQFGLLDFSGDAWVATLYLSGFATAIVAGHALAAADSRGTAAMLSGALLGGSLISAVLGLTQALQIGGFGIWVLDATPGMRAYANLAQPNNLATLIGMGAVALLLLREQSRLSSRVCALVLAVLVVGISLTQSRTALLFGPLIWVALRAARRRGTPFKTRQATVVVATALHWLLTWGWPALQKALMLDAAVSLGTRGAESVRFQMWPILIAALGESPWHGFGWLQVGAAELSVVDRYPPVGELWLHGHNLLLELLLWCGYPLGLLLCGLVLYWAVSRWIRVVTLEAVIGAMLIGVFGLHAMLELPYHYAYFLIPVGLWIGLIEASLDTRGLLPVKWNLLPPALGLVLLLGIWKDYPSVEEDFRVMRFETLGIGTARAAQPAPDAPFLSSLTSFLRFTRIAPTPGMSSAELARMEAVVKRYPYPAVMFRVASAWALNGRLADARQLFIKIRHIYDESTYRKMRSALHERVVAGEAGLMALEHALPD